MFSDADRSGETSTDGPTSVPSFADVTVEAPSEGTVDEGFEVTVGVTNEGDATGEFTGTLELSGPRNGSQSVTVEGVDPGESGTQTVSFEVEYAGTYTARLPGTDASTEVVVHPRDADLGEAAALAPDLDVTVHDARVEPPVIAVGRGPVYLHGTNSRMDGVPHLVPGTDPAAAPEGHPVARLDEEADVYLLVVEATVTNDGDQPRTFDPAPLVPEAEAGTDPAFYSDVGREVFEGVTVADAEATVGSSPLAGVEVGPGETATGWLLAPVARETASDGGIEIGIQRKPIDDEVDEGPVEAVWQVVPEGGTALPQFEVEDLSMPDRVPNLTTAEFSLQVTNTGETAGTYRDVLEISGIMPEFDPVGQMSGEVDPGETVEVAGEFFMAWGAEQGFRLQKGNPEVINDLEEYDVDRGAHGECVGWWLELPFGEEATFTNGTIIRAQNPVYAENFEYSDGIGSGNRVLLVNVEAYLPEWARGKRLGENLLPALEDFEYDIHPDWEPEDPLRILSALTRRKAESNGNSLYEPIKGKLYPVSPPEEPDNATVQGWIELRNPDDDQFEEYPREERELRVEVPVKRRGGYAKVAGVKWAQKFK
ncbi:hypothetical protein BRD00_10130 [Halobacteriales archaeon QS_8_69_26]|nr:MAG: hypothetical protein BRD00_10130 [Halobacteriales archaeon QS_8_69_26]